MLHSGVKVVGVQRTKGNNQPGQTETCLHVRSHADIKAFFPTPNQEQVRHVFVTASEHLPLNLVALINAVFPLDSQLNVQKAK